MHWWQDSQKMFNIICHGRTCFVWWQKMCTMGKQDKKSQCGATSFVKRSFFLHLLSFFCIFCHQTKSVLGQKMSFFPHWTKDESSFATKQKMQTETDDIMAFGRVTKTALIASQEHHTNVLTFHTHIISTSQLHVGTGNKTQWLGVPQNHHFPHTHHFHVTIACKTNKQIQCKHNKIKQIEAH